MKLRDNYAVQVDQHGLHLLTSEFYEDNIVMIVASVYHEGDDLVILWNDGTTLRVGLETGNYELFIRSMEDD